MRRILTIFCVLCAVSASAAADVNAGKTKASAACATCHGMQGMSSLPNAPNLAGQPQIYLAEQLKNYRSGKRTHEVMSVVAKPLSDQEIDDLSAWYASLKVELRETK
jgi:cytochrome c553